MGRNKGKLPMKPIDHERSRRVTFGKRKKGLKKKTFEFVTLCGVEACMVCFGPDGELETWPEKHTEVAAIINRYKSLSKDDQEKRKLDISSFMDAKKKKLEEELDRTRKENSKLLYGTWDIRLDGLSEKELRDFGSLLESKLEKVREKVEMLKANQSSVKGKEIEMVRETNQNQSPYSFDMHHQPFLIPRPTSECIYNPMMFDALLNTTTMIRPSNYYCDTGCSSTGVSWAPPRGSIYNPGFEMVEKFVPPMIPQPPPLRTVLPSMLQQSQPVIRFQPQTTHQLGDGSFNYYSQDLDLKTYGGKF